MAVCLKVRIVIVFLIQSVIDNTSISMSSQCSCPSKRTDALTAAAAPAPNNCKCVIWYSLHLFGVTFSICRIELTFQY